MRYLFRTSYQQDLRAWRHAGDVFWYSLLVIIIVAIPFILDEFYVGEMGGCSFTPSPASADAADRYTGLISLVTPRSLASALIRTRCCCRTVCRF